MTTLANLHTYLSNDYLRDPNSRIRPTDTKTRAINQAYRKLQADMLFSTWEQELTTTQTLTSWTSQYDKPTLTATVTSIVIDNSELLFTTFDEAIEMWTIAQGKPYAYYIRANKINYIPTPNTDYTATVYYQAWLTDMETGDSSEYPSDYDDALLCYASYILFNQVQKYDNAVAMRNRYEEAINAIKMKVFYTDRALFMNM